MDTTWSAFKIDELRSLNSTSEIPGNASLKNALLGDNYMQLIDDATYKLADIKELASIKIDGIANVKSNTLKNALLKFVLKKRATYLYIFKYHFESLLTVQNELVKLLGTAESQQKQSGTYAETIERMQSEIATVNTQLQEKSFKIAELEARLAESKRQAENASKAQQQAANAAQAQKQAAQLQKQAANASKAQQQAANAAQAQKQAANAAAQVQRQLGQKQAEIAALQAQAQQQIAYANAKAESSQARIADLIKENDELQRQLSECKASDQVLQTTKGKVGEVAKTLNINTSTQDTVAILSNVITKIDELKSFAAQSSRIHAALTEIPLPSSQGGAM